MKEYFYMPADPTHLTSLFENATEGIILTNGTGNICAGQPGSGTDVRL